MSKPDNPVALATLDTLDDIAGQVEQLRVLLQAPVSPCALAELLVEVQKLRRRLDRHAAKLSSRDGKAK